MLVGGAEVLRSPDVSASIVAASMLATMLRFATPLTLGALAGLLCERSGVANIAIEGMMLSAAFGAFLGAAATKNLLIGVLAGMAVGVAMATLHAWLSVSLRVDQIVSGTVINIMAAGITGFLSTEVVRRQALVGAGLLPALRIPVLADLPVVGPVFQQQPIAWVSLLLVPITHLVIFHTPWGLRLRSVGELPRAAHAAGRGVAYVERAGHHP
ncbi:MAG: ABC transporter permease, partial [Proteobacteria bacterium]|nr:ABC transporter permease [Pseudomonadota bacterium]